MAQSCFECPYRNSSCVLAGQSRAAVREVSNSLKRLSFQGKGKVIFHQGEPFDGYYLLCEGSVKLVKVLKNGAQIIPDVLTPFSFMSLIPEGGSPRQACSAVTVVELSRVAHIKAARLNTLLGQFPALGFAIARHFSARLRACGRHLASMKLPVRDRVLGYVAGKMAFGEPERSKQVIPLHVTQRELAEIIQTSPETLSRAFRALQDDGIVRVRKGSIEVLKVDAVEEFYND
jgi:CRP/FNR family transcriptional regulator